MAGLMDLQENTTPESPAKTWQPPTNLDNLNGNSWGGEVEPSKLALQTSFDTLRQIPGIRNEGVKAGTDAANALFAANGSGISAALQAKAKRSFDRSMQRNQLANEIHGYERTRLAAAQGVAEQNQIYKLRRANLTGQLQWADKVATYNQAMETTKLGLLSSIISGGMAIAGFAVGGPAAAAAAAGLAGGAKEAMK